ncbi:33389_t:CDS:2, partial [Racocetra persica]
RKFSRQGLGIWEYRLYLFGETTADVSDPMSELLKNKRERARLAAQHFSKSKKPKASYHSHSEQPQYQAPIFQPMSLQNQFGGSLTVSPQTAQTNPQFLHGVTKTRDSKEERNVEKHKGNFEQHYNRKNSHTEGSEILEGDNKAISVSIKVAKERNSLVFKESNAINNQPGPKALSLYR